MIERQHEPSDGKVHVRERASALVSEPVLCGKRDQSSVSEAWGFWGPGGAGFPDICTLCFDAQKKNKGK